MLPAHRLVIGGAIAAAAAICALPPIYMIGAAAVEPGAAALPLVLDPRQQALLATTLLLSTGTAALATAIGVPLGLILARVRLGARRAWRLVLTVPLVVPPYVLALAWIDLGGSAGLIARFAGADRLSGWTHSLGGAMLVLGLGFYPLSMLATEAAARQLDGRLEEAARLAASPARVWARITMPLIAPGVLAAALVVFVLALSEFGVPSLLRVRVFTTEVFTAFAAFYDFARATSLALPLLAAALLAGSAATALVGDRLLASTRRTTPPAPVMLGRRRAAVLALPVLVVLVAVVVPLAVLGLEARRLGSPAALLAGSQAAIANSLIFAGAGATLSLALAFWLGYARARTSRRLGHLADVLLVVLFAVPGTVVGVGLIGLWNRPGLAGAVYASPIIIVLAYLARFVPVAALILAVAVRQVPVSSEEAAAVGGAGWLRTVTRIVVPQIGAWLVAAWAVVFILAFGELGASVLVAPPGESTLPIHVYTMIANAPSSHVAGLALLQTGVVVLPLCALAWLQAGRSASHG